MKVVAGLGNPGSNYQKTRHNVGYMFLDYLKDSFFPKLEFKEEKKFSSLVLKSTKLVFLKPTTFMNLSGQAIQAYLSFYKIPKDNLVVVHDDLDLKLGSWKLQFGVGPKVHNGLNSIENNLGTKDFWRLRIGIDNRQPGYPGSGEDYVLEHFMSDEIDTLTGVFQLCQPEIKQILD